MKKFRYLFVVILLISILSLGLVACDNQTKEEDKPTECNHEYEYKIKQNPTCTEKGIEEGICKHCGDKKNKDIAIIAHNVENDKCTICGVAMTTELIYTELEDGTVGVKLATQPASSNIIIPEKVYGKPVTTIMNAGFSGKNFQTISFPSTLTTIETAAFSRCNELEEIVIPESVKHLGNQVFYMCKNLKSIKISSGIKELPMRFVAGCKKLTNFDFSNIEKIGEFAFQLSGLGGELVLPSNVKNLGEGCFTGTNITSVKIEGNIKVIPNFAFEDCNSLLKVEIGEGVVEIGEEAFSNMQETLDECYIPKSIHKIGSMAFDRPDVSAKKVVYSGSFADWLKIDFGSRSANPTYRDSLYATDCEFYINNTELVGNHIVIPDSITELKDYSLVGLTFVTELTIPSSIQKIGVDVLHNTPDISRVNYQGDIKDYIGLFSTNPGELWKSIDLYLNGTLLEEVVVDEGVTTLNNAFKGVKSLKKVTLPNSMTEINEKEFFECSNLNTIIFGNNVQKIGENAFASSGITELILPDSVEILDASAFNYCKNLTKVVLSKNLLSIGDFCFYGCGKLQSVEMYNKITYIGRDSFKVSASGGQGDFEYINFNGTIEEFKAIEKYDKFFMHSSVEIRCSNGTITIDDL